jgi:hypothetical protein
MIKLYIHRQGSPETDVVEVAPETPLGEAISAEPGAVALLEDTDKELELELAVADTGVAERGHVFTGKSVKELVEVTYNLYEADDTFPASTRVDHVFKWAVKQFKLGKEDAAEHTLALCNTDVIPPEDTHIGELDAEATGKVCFALVPKHRFEG